MKRRPLNSVLPIAACLMVSSMAWAADQTIDTGVDYRGTYTVKSAPSIQAPSLTTTLSDTCMGSTSFGLSFIGFGATGATTMVDQACVKRLDAREFRAMGLNDVALALMCQSDANRRAVEATGHVCPGSPAPVAQAPAEATPPLSSKESSRTPMAKTGGTQPAATDTRTSVQPEVTQSAHLTTPVNTAGKHASDLDESGQKVAAAGPSRPSSTVLLTGTNSPQK